PAAEELPEGRVYDRDAIINLFPSDNIAHVVRSFPIGQGLPPKIAVPPGTKLFVIPPHVDSRHGEVGEISLKNRYCTITIGTRQMGGLGGIGEYAVLGGFDSLLADQIQA